MLKIGLKSGKHQMESRRDRLGSVEHRRRIAGRQEGVGERGGEGSLQGIKLVNRDEVIYVVREFLERCLFGRGHVADKLQLLEANIVKELVLKRLGDSDIAR